MRSCVVVIFVLVLVADPRELTCSIGHAAPRWAATAELGQHAKLISGGICVADCCVNSICSHHRSAGKVGGNVHCTVSTSPSSSWPFFNVQISRNFWGHKFSKHTCSCFYLTSDDCHLGTLGCADNICFKVKKMWPDRTGRSSSQKISEKSANLQKNLPSAKAISKVFPAVGEFVENSLCRKTFDIIVRQLFRQGKLQRSCRENFWIIHPSKHWLTLVGKEKEKSEFIDTRRFPASAADHIMHSKCFSSLRRRKSKSNSGWITGGKILAFGGLGRLDSTTKGIQERC